MILNSFAYLISPSIIQKWAFESQHKSFWMVEDRKLEGIVGNLLNIPVYKLNPKINPNFTFKSFLSCWDRKDCKECGVWVCESTFGYWITRIITVICRSCASFYLEKFAVQSSLSFLAPTSTMQCHKNMFGHSKHNLFPCSMFRTILTLFLNYGFFLLWFFYVCFLSTSNIYTAAVDLDDDSLTRNVW